MLDKTLPLSSFWRMREPGTRNRSELPLLPVYAAWELNGPPPKDGVSYDLRKMHWEPRRVRVYLAGPMRGIADFNFPAFHKGAADLASLGYAVFNPAAEDEKNYGAENFKGSGNEEALKACGFSLRKVLGGDLRFICEEADIIALLPGWSQSKGAKIEYATAKMLGLKVMYMPDAELAPEDDPAYKPQIIGLERTSGEVRITDTKTGGQKGQKPERFDLIPVYPLEELARLYGWGCTKYADDNWRKGYSWKLSFGAMMRHAWAFWRRESIDKETGLHHLAAVAWHAFTLMWFERYEKGTDDRAELLLKGEKFE